MLFNSLDFAIFLPVVFAIYWLLKNQLRWQNLFLLVSSYFFYGWWDWRFLVLIALSSLLDFWVARRITKSEIKNRSKWLSVSIIANLGLLGFFKYFNFFLESFQSAFTLLGHSVESNHLEIILPVGISFYTFQSLSYTIDVFRKRLEPTEDFFAFATFVSFFPQLVAGPIERATNFLPQFTEKRSFTYKLAADGGRQILWGLFKKMVIADNCAAVVEALFQDPSANSGMNLMIGACLFSIQIYGDFSGYSDMAIGIGKLFGFRMRQNFNVPFFSRNMSEMWTRWHISLSSWFKDYLYIPLGGSRGSISLRMRNVLLVFALSGLWHGANWTFVCWGFANGLFVLAVILLNKRSFPDRIAEGCIVPSLRELLHIVNTFMLFSLCMIFFRSPSINVAFSYFDALIDISLFSIPTILNFELLLLISLLFGVEWLQRDRQHGLEGIVSLPRFWRWSIYYLICSLILWFGVNHQTFIYFQF